MDVSRMLGKLKETRCTIHTGEYRRSLLWVLYAQGDLDTIRIRLMEPISGNVSPLIVVYETLGIRWCCCLDILHVEPHASRE